MKAGQLNSYTKPFSILMAIIISTIAVELNGQKLLTLDECINTALDKNLLVLDAEYATEISQKEYHRSLAQLLPVLSAYAQESYNSGRNFNNQLGIVVDQKYSSGVGGISGSLQLFNGFQDHYAIQQNKMGIKASQEELNIIREDIIGLVIRTFYQIIVSTEQMQFYSDQISHTESVMRRTEILVEEGQRRQTELYRIKAQYEQEKMSLLQAENSILLAKNNLATLMHADNFIEITVIDSTQVNPEFFLEGFDSLQSQTLSYSPLLKNKYYLQEISEYQLKGSRRAFLPNLSLNANVSNRYTSNAKNLENPFIDYSINDQFNDNLFSQVNLTLSIPIFSGFQVKYNSNISKLRNLQAVNNYERAKLEVQYTTRQMYLTAKAAYQNYMAAQELVKANELTYQYTERSYELGTVSIIELTTSSNDLMNAKMSLTEAKVQYIINCKILELNASGEY